MNTIRRTGIARRRKQTSLSEKQRRGNERRSLEKNPDKIIERLRKIPMFEGLTTEQLKKMLSICSKKKFEISKNIYTIGEESDNMFILIKGKIGITFNTGVDLQSIAPAGIVGEMGIFTGEKRSANVVAETECMVLNFSRTELYRLFSSDANLHIKILMNIIKDLSKKMRGSNEQIDQLLYRIRVLDIM